mmetsp:Transcript_5026/g.17437  ORF Transcript_5026/g.17437 Transcript_5026/m.17437 type:complete len:244 (+) Transcript_5026:184-915(+)
MPLAAARARCHLQVVYAGAGANAADFDLIASLASAVGRTRPSNSAHASGGEKNPLRGGPQTRSATARTGVLHAEKLAKLEEKLVVLREKVAELKTKVSEGERKTLDEVSELTLVRGKEEDDNDFAASSAAQLAVADLMHEFLRHGEQGELEAAINRRAARRRHQPHHCRRHAARGRTRPLPPAGGIRRGWSERGGLRPHRELGVRGGPNEAEQQRPRLWRGKKPSQRRTTDAFCNSSNGCATR